MSLSYQEMEKLLGKLVKDAAKSRKDDQSTIDISEIKDILKDMAEKAESSSDKENNELGNIDKDLKEAKREGLEADRDKKSSNNHDDLMKLLAQRGAGKTTGENLDLAGSLLAFGAGLKRITGEFDTVKNSYQTMVANGSGWSGDMLNMGKTINKAGFEVDEFTKMMAEGGAGVKAAGGPEYLKFAQNTRELNIQMGRMGLSQGDQIRMMSSYTDILRNSGELTKIGTQEAADKFRNLVGSSERLAGAFGMTVQQFMDLRAQFSKDKEVVLSTFGMSSTQAKNVQDLAASLTSAYGENNAKTIAMAAATYRSNGTMSKEAYTLSALNPEINRLIHSMAGRLDTDYSGRIDSDGKPMSIITSNEVEQSRQNILQYDRTSGLATPIQWSGDGTVKSEAIRATADLAYRADIGEVGQSRENPNNGNGTGTPQTETTKDSQEAEESRSKLNASTESILTSSMDALNKTIGKLLEIDRDANLQAAKQNYSIAEAASTSLSHIDGAMAQFLQDNKQSLTNELTMIKQLEIIAGLIGMSGLGGLLQSLSKGGKSSLAARRSRRARREKVNEDDKKTSTRGKGNSPDDTPPPEGGGPGGKGPKGGGGSSPSENNIRENISNDNSRLVNNAPANDDSIFDRMRHAAANDSPHEGTILSEHAESIKETASESRLSKILNSSLVKKVSNSNYAEDIKDLLKDYDKHPLSSAREAAKGFGVLGTGIAVASSIPDYLEISRKENTGEITKNKANDEKDRLVGDTAGKVVGGAVGMDIGATVGSIVPVVGTAIGGIAGAYLGSEIGGWIGDKAGHTVHSVLGKNDDPNPSSTVNPTPNAPEPTTQAPVTPNNSTSNNNNVSATDTNNSAEPNTNNTSTPTGNTPDRSIVRNDMAPNPTPVLDSFAPTPQSLITSTWTDSVSPNINLDTYSPPSQDNSNVNTTNSGDAPSGNNPQGNNNSSVQSDSTGINSNNDQSDILKAIKSSFDQFFDNSNENSTLMLQILNQINTNGSQANSILRNNGSYIG